MILKIKRPNLPDVTRDLSIVYQNFQYMLSLKQNHIDPALIKNHYGGLLYIHFYNQDTFDLLEIYKNKPISANSIIIGRMVEYHISSNTCYMLGEVTETIISDGWLLL